MTSVLILILTYNDVYLEIDLDLHWRLSWYWSWPTMTSILILTLTYNGVYLDIDLNLQWLLFLILNLTYLQWRLSWYWPWPTMTSILILTLTYNDVYLDIDLYLFINGLTHIPISLMVYMCSVDLRISTIWWWNFAVSFPYCRYRNNLLNKKDNKQKSANLF